ncbi:anti-sigma factor [Blastococcus sp. SYSU D00820]
MPQHCTPEDLALAALGEPLPADDTAHLTGCAACTAEVASLRRAVDALAVPEFAASAPPVAPPASVWAAIAAATGVDDAPSAPPAPAPAPTPAPPPEPLAEVRQLRPRRSQLLLAAAAALLVGVGIGAGAVALGNRDDDSAVAVAAAALDPLDGSGASGEAAVLEREDGSRVLRIQLDADDPSEGYYEVWLLDEAVERLVPVGVVGPGTEEFVLPPGIDLGEYPVVDVSVEPLDGDPEHSGDSIARGVLDT